MITRSYRASDLFVVRRTSALSGNPAWADLTIDSNRTLANDLARGAGLYAMHFRGVLIYVGKFCGKRSDPFEGRICDIRWSRHIGTLTLRDRRISLSEGRGKQFRGSSAAPLVDIENAMQAATIRLNRGRATSINRALFAAEHWADFVRIEHAADLEAFSLTYTQIEPTDGIDRSRIRDIVSHAEKMAIDSLQPRCNGEVREGRGKTATAPEAAEVLITMLAQAIAAAGGGNAPPPPAPPQVAADVPDGNETAGRAQVDGDGGGPEDPDDPADVTAEELFWERIEGQPQATTAVNLLIEALSDVADADFHFTQTNTADLRVHSLAGPRARFNAACHSWQPTRRGFISEIGLPVDTCLALGATTAKPNHAGRTLSTIATFDPAGAPDAMCRCTLAALDAYRGAFGR